MEEAAAKIWEGNLSGVKRGQPVFITRLEGYSSASASETLAAYWPETMRIVRLISQDRINNMQYVGKADFLVFRANTQHGFLHQLQEMRLYAVIQLPSQTLLLSVSDNVRRLIGMLFSHIPCVPGGVPGGGTHRDGEGASGNMCRGDRMFAPTKIWRRWHRKINVNQKRDAVVSAISASAIPSLVMARGHRIKSVPELQLVISDSAESVEKTSAAIKVLKQIGAYAYVEKVKDSHAIRPGKGKMRNRRYISGKGPLVLCGTEGAKLVKAFRNIPGVEIANVDRLNLLRLAPGGHLGRFVIWTKSAFEKLDSIYGTFEKPSEKKKGYVLPRPKMVNADLARIINSDEVQSVVKPIKKDVKRAPLKKNPLKNLNARRMSLLAEAQRVKAKKEKLEKKRKTISKEEAAAIKSRLERHGTRQ